MTTKISTPKRRIFGTSLPPYHRISWSMKRSPSTGQKGLCNACRSLPAPRSIQATAVLGAADADILVSLKEHHHPTAAYVRELRQSLPRAFPGVTLYFLPADMVTQILNFGVPVPVDIHIEGTDLEGNHQVANRMLQALRQVPGLTDLRIQQVFDYPKWHVDIDRTKAVQGGFKQQNIAKSILNSLSGNSQITPMFFLNWQNGVSYNLVAQTPQYKMPSLQELQNTPISSATMTRPEILANVASITREQEMQVVSHYNIRRVVDIYGAVQDRDLRAV